MKNLVDSEVMLGLLKQKGYEITPYEGQADILVVNTCAFIDAAKQESVDTILELASSDDGHNRKIIVAGCLAQRYGNRLEEEFGDGIHAIVGTGDFHHITDACEAVLAGASFFHRVSDTPDYLYHEKTPRLRTTPSHYAYVKIAEGCDNCCSYCVIPQVRGRYRSRSIESVVSEVASLALSGVREVNLIAQDTTNYGWDLQNGELLPSLLKQLVRISDVGWIRILYGHPAHISDEFLALIAAEDKICSYVDIPVQHINSDILRKMSRQTTQEQIYGIIEKIRSMIPDVTLRTSLIVGFPGETEQHFGELVQFVKQAQFDHLGVFAYSAEEDTRAAEMSNPVPDSVKQERLDQIAQLHEEIAATKRQRLVGRREVVLVDSGGNQAVGRTQGQAPEIDDVVYIADGKVKSGEFLDLEIVDTCGPYDLIGRII
jgi:ribosomal protein S12 methylthiotransferase